jgi:hypothetical protein
MRRLLSSVHNYQSPSQLAVQVGRSQGLREVCCQCLHNWRWLLSAPVRPAVLRHSYCQVRDLYETGRFMPRAGNITATKSARKHICETYPGWRYRGLQYLFYCAPGLVLLPEVDSNFFHFSYNYTHFSTQSTYIRFEFFTTVTIKNAVFWNVTPDDSCKNRSFGRTQLATLNSYC